MEQNFLAALAAVVVLVLLCWGCAAVLLYKPKPDAQPAAQQPQVDHRTFAKLPLNLVAAIKGCCSEQTLRVRGGRGGAGDMTLSIGDIHFHASPTTDRLTSPLICTAHL